jgi:hypothetical protein
MISKRDVSTGAANRRWPRFNPSEVPCLKGVTINQGAEAQVIDISQGGTLIETDIRLQPKMKIALKVITTLGAFKITGSVLRSSIASLKGIPIYQSAIIFDNPLTALEDLEAKSAEEMRRAENEFLALDIEETAECNQPKIVTEGKQDLDSAIFKVIAPDGICFPINESFGLNDW